MPSFFFHITADLVHPTHDTIVPAAARETHLASHKTVLDVEPLTPKASTHDWRYSKNSFETIVMAATVLPDRLGSDLGGSTQPTHAISSGSGSLANKGRYEASEPKKQELGWGVIRLYRDVEETPGLYDEPTSNKQSKGTRHHARKDDEETSVFKDEDCTTLCILAVPSYLTPSDFLGFVGEKTREEVSHFRMIRSERTNRYMVLMKFRSGKRARLWRREWNGRPFDGMGSENCQVVFVKSISVQTPSNTNGQTSSFPDMSNDPFTPSIAGTLGEKGLSSPSAAPITAPPTTIATPSRTLSKPAPPPTPSLIELPTCPVCLERMDESTGLLTILCQHVFHCTCLQKWKGSGCPVCRYTHSSFPASGRRSNSSNGVASTEGSSEQAMNECSVCHSDANLWICLICGSIGCGRYDGAHAFQHYEQSSHCFAMEFASQRVWDYASDHYVHRILQDQTDGKFVELTHPSEQDPSARHNQQQNRSSLDDETHEQSNAQGNMNTDDARDEENELVPRRKLTSIGLEYTALLTSQLESQRSYYEEILHRSADKTALATAAAESASVSAAESAHQLTLVRHEQDRLTQETLPALERDRERASKKAERFETMARRLEKEWRDEKAMNDSLMIKMRSLEEDLRSLKAQLQEAEEEKRDLAFFISGGQKLRDLAGTTKASPSHAKGKKTAESATDDIGRAGRRPPTKEDDDSNPTDEQITNTNTNISKEATSNDPNPDPDPESESDENEIKEEEILGATIMIPDPPPPSDPPDTSGGGNNAKGRKGRGSRGKGKGRGKH